MLEAASALTAPLREALPSSSDEWAAIFREDDANGKLVRFVAGRLWERRADAPLLSARLAGRVLLRAIDRVDGLAGASTVASAGSSSSSSSSALARSRPRSSPAASSASPRDSSPSRPRSNARTPA